MKIGIQTGTTNVELGFAEAYRLYAEAGFETVDWNMNDYLMGNLINKGEYKGNIFEKSVEEILEHVNPEISEIKKNGLEIAEAHAPFPAYVPGKPEMLDYMIEIYKKNILVCHAIGCKHLVIHGITLAYNNRIDTPETVAAMNEKLYTSLIPTLVQTDVTVCLENLFTGAGGVVVSGHCSEAHIAAETIDRYNALAGKECFGLCLDTGHLNMLKLDFRNYISVLGNRIKMLHIHDNHGVKDSHKAPYTGTLVWKDFYTELRKIGYNGDLSFETYMQTSLKTIDVELLPAWLKLIHEIGVHFKNKITEQ